MPLALNGEVLSLMPKPRNLGFGRVGLLVFFSPAVATTTTMVSFYCSYEAALKNLPISKNINTQDFWLGAPTVHIVLFLGIWYFSYFYANTIFRSAGKIDWVSWYRCLFCTSIFPFPHITKNLHILSTYNADNLWLMVHERFWFQYWTFSNFYISSLSEYQAKSSPFAKIWD